MGFSELMVKYFYKTKYKVVFLRRLNGSVFFITAITKKSIDDVVKVNSHNFYIKKGTPAYINANIRIYLVDYDTGEQFAFTSIESPVSPEQLDIFLGTRLIKDLASSVLDNKKERVFWIIAGAIVGALIASIVAMVVMQGKIDSIMQDVLDKIGQNELPF